LPTIVIVLILVNPKATLEERFEAKNKILGVKNETLEKCLPSIDSIEEGVKVYRHYSTYEQERMSGIIAIRMRLEK
jgi:ASC-1-like (ASCH) protein